MEFDKKTIVVTGAASGIGFATARAFAVAGGTVVGVDIDGAGAERATKALGELADRVVFEIADLSSTAGCEAAIAGTLSRHGRVDVLCNVAGIAELHHFTDVRPEQFDRMVRINLGSVFFLSQAAMPSLLASRGNIVSVASVAGLTGNPYNSLYCATKGAIVNLTRALAVEYSKRGVRVNCVCPGSVLTEATKQTRIPEGTDPALFGVMTPPLGHCQPEEIADAILYLASDRARYITGIALPVDGGRTAI